MTKGLGVAAAALLMLGGKCPTLDEGRSVGPQISNASDEAVRIMIVRDEEYIDEGSTLAPGQSDPLVVPSEDTNGCTTEVLAAVTADDSEIDRAQPGLCTGETWVMKG
jgi:hypothetical protein